MKYAFKYLNFISILFFAYISIVFQSTLLHQFFGIYKPTLFVILISYLSLSRFTIEGALLSFFIGYFVELNSGAPFGLYSAILVLTFLSAKLLSRSIMIQNTFGEMLFVVMGSLFFKIFFLCLFSLYGSLTLVKLEILTGASSAFLNFLLTPLLFFALKIWDELLGKELPQKLEGEERQL